MSGNRHQPIVIKYGGAAMQTPALMKAVMQDIAYLKTLQLHPIVVHGGGPEISKRCEQAGIVPQFIDGVRITDCETMAIAQMVLIGKINKELVSLLNREGIRAVGISGHDGHLFLAKKCLHPSGIDLGFVGEITHVNTELLQTLMRAGYIPVIAPIAASFEIDSYNINADTAATEIALAMQAEHLIFLTDVEGLLHDPKDPSTKIDRMSGQEVQALIDSGRLYGGMIPKIRGALEALKRGVEQVHILDGRTPHCLLLHFSGAKNLGTTFIANEPCGMSYV